MESLQALTPEVVDCGEGKAVGYHIRTLCWGGPCDGQVLFAPLLVPSWFSNGAAVVSFPDGCYRFTMTTAEQRATGRHLFALLGEPRHGFGAWTWRAGEHPDQIDADELIIVSFRKVRIFALANYDG